MSKKHKEKNAKGFKGFFHNEHLSPTHSLCDLIAGGPTAWNPTDHENRGPEFPGFNRVVIKSAQCRYMVLTKIAKYCAQLSAAVRILGCSSIQTGGLGIPILMISRSSSSRTPIHQTLFT